MQLTSPNFKNGQRLPDRFTLDFQNQSPPLEWSDVPAGTVEFALICEDPDAPMGTWIHWVIYGIPSVVDHMNAGIPKTPIVEDLGKAKQGKNDFGNLGYDGPRPPRGPQHRYFFRLFALKEPLDLKHGATASQLRKAMEGKILAEAELMGTYSR